MNTTLSFTVDNKTYVSKEFDFEAFCLINDNHGTEGENYIRWSYRAVEYMFRGTDATAEIIAALPIAERVRMCMDAWDMYVDTLKNVKRRPHTV